MVVRKLLPWLTAALVIAGDRVTKILVLRHLELGSWRPVLPGVSLTHVHNTGIAFSLFSEGGWLSRMLLHAVILTAVVLIGWMLFRHDSRRTVAGVAFGMILGGAIGNLVDRVLYGWVIDFVRLWIRIGERTWSWPDFNVADSAITAGAVLLILSELAAHRRGQGHASDPG